jgi:acetyl-CoA/propionyl-CoA carboxylase biotin carboxyl carrier protein
VVAFGRGECFVERYLDRPRHVETQCLADRHGNVVVVSSRDCTVQRRHQKLIEEAPAPFLSPDQDAELRRVSKAILAEAGYLGAGTCEFMISGDDVYFLEVNARLQVEHPVTEEVTGSDLVAEMLRLARDASVVPVVADQRGQRRVGAFDEAYVPEVGESPGSLGDLVQQVGSDRFGG